MKTIQMTLDENLLHQIDETVKELNMTRSAYIRESILHYLKKTKIKQLERQHRQGYLKKPVEDNEFDIWENEQVWS